MALIDLSTPDPQRNRRNGLIMAIIVVLYLAIIIKCSAQNKNDYLFYKPDTISRITTAWSATFGVFTPSGAEDTIFLGICVDSLKPNKYERYIFVYYPKETKIISPRLDIGFDKEGIISLNRDRIVPPYNFVSYLLTDEQYEKLRKYKFEYINFHIDDYDIPFVFNEGDEYFIKFFKAI